MDVEAEIGSLFGLPLDEFTAGRDRIAAQLKDAGASDDARRVKALKKPVVSAWALNQLARHERPALEALAGAAAKIESARNPAELRAATDERKRHIAALSKSARSILEAAGHGASAATLDRIGKALLAVTEESVREQLLAGHLSEDPEATGLGGWGLAVSEETDDTDATEEAREKEAARDRAEQLARDAEAAEREAREAHRELDNARTAVERAERAAQKATARAEQLRTRADDALNKL